MTTMIDQSLSVDDVSDLIADAFDWGIKIPRGRR